MNTFDRNWNYEKMNNNIVYWKKNGYIYGHDAVLKRYSITGSNDFDLEIFMKTKHSHIIDEISEKIVKSWFIIIVMILTKN